MPKFDEFFEHFTGDLVKSEAFDPDQFKAAALAAYQEDIQGITSVVTEKDQEIAAEKARTEALGRENWKLMMKLGTPIPDGTTPTDLNPDGKQGETAPRSIDSFFGTPKKVE